MLNDNELHALATKAILDAMGPEEREKLLARAVSSLFEKAETVRYSYSNDKRTKLEAAFDNALELAAAGICVEMLREEKYQEAIRTAVSAAVDKALLGEGREEFISLVSGAVRVGLEQAARNR